MIVRLVAALAMAAAVVATAHADSPLCRPPLSPMQVVELYFGRGGGVTEGRWARFLAREITPRFPDGLTVVDGSGQWRARQSKRIVRERTKIVTIAAAKSEDLSARIEAIVNAYKQRFRQKSVGIILRDGCGAF